MIKLLGSSVFTPEPQKRLNHDLHVMNYIPQLVITMEHHIFEIASMTKRDRSNYFPPTSCDVQYKFT